MAMRSGDFARARHVVRDRERGDAEILHGRDDQIVDHVGHDGIEAGGRLVEEDDFRIGRDGARQPTRFCMPPDNSDGESAPLPARGPPCELFDRDVARLLARHAAALDQAEGDVLPDRQAVEQRRALEQHAEFRSIASRARPRQRVTSCAVDENLPSSGVRMPSTHLMVTDLPVPEPPMTTSDCPLDREIDAVEHDLGPKRFLTPRNSILGVRSSPSPSPRTGWR
jgi:hypothetical protein